MGVYIKGERIPNNCVDCVLYDGIAHCLDGKYIECPFYAINKLDYQNERFEKCPLVEVKEPHGRLIDADALVNTVYYTNISESVKEFIADLIGIAPTVIEAEEG